MKKTEKYIEEVIKNIRDDRDITRRLLDDVMVYLSKSEERHKEVGLTAAKYVETLQRSNEQLVKISALLQKDASLCLVEGEQVCAKPVGRMFVFK